MENKFALQEERINAFSHGIGVCLSVYGLFLLLQRSALFEDRLYMVSNVIFGASLCLVYVSSTLLHGTRSLKWGKRFEMLDHAAIFIAMAGSYTPFLLITWQSRMATELLIVIWALAFAGVRYVHLIIQRFMPWGLLFYLGMGAFMMLFFVPLYVRLPHMAFIWLALGMASYMAGVPFFLWQKLRFHHAVWHLFVLGGSACHFIAVYSYVMPALL
ncbi:PAQR family membrane homeostasis protein TrhA [Paenibacillus roseipurpureus]|uniref:Hemolysin III family protein n=1 Tax=Paenibacillus roseopurpureus TaxID=2918901 RepID=A0AA96LUG1_9BACL|nr:hemolysin III family protein [Paenibacillus sp. MBLB1832]WNR46239.1 hemolysin III family protein [Paenibacillus sp. MBLB1832]